MRYGTRTISAKKWTAQGHRPTSPMKYGYLFQACQPSTGETFEMFLPNMSGDCFRVFMQEFAAKHPNQTMIMDNAGCHHVKWDEEIYPDVEIVYLPPYSPDFNPQERLFQEFKKELKGKIFNDLDEIEVVITKKLEYYWRNPRKVSRLTNWSP